MRNPHAARDAIVRVGPLTSIPAVLRELDSDPAPVFDSAGFDIAGFSDPDTEIPYLAASRLLARCVSVTGCEHFGLLLGMRAGPSCLGVAGFLLSSAPDVATALHGLLQHLDLHDQGGVPTLQIENGIARLGYAIHEPGAQATDQIYDLAVASPVWTEVERNRGVAVAASTTGPGALPAILSRTPALQRGPKRCHVPQSLA